MAHYISYIWTSDTNESYALWLYLQLKIFQLQILQKLLSYHNSNWNIKNPDVLVQH